MSTTVQSRAFVSIIPIQLSGAQLPFCVGVMNINHQPPAFTGGILEHLNVFI
jgi:hypothetical protein